MQDNMSLLLKSKSQTFYYRITLTSLVTFGLMSFFPKSEIFGFFFIEHGVAMFIHIYNFRGFLQN